MFRALYVPAVAALMLFAAPAAAETTVVHSVEGRFGVSYVSDPNAPRGGMQSLYEGRYTASFRHQADNGLQFRFDIGVVVGNIPSDRRGHGLATPSAGALARN